MPVRTLLDYLAAGDSLDEFLDRFPTVSREQAVGREQAKDLLVAHAHPLMSVFRDRSAVSWPGDSPVQEMGWAGKGRRTARPRGGAGFEVLLTVDQNLNSQQNLSGGEES